ncbi:GNAT family N-acetyltransferase [Roseibium sp. SCPC15]|uniref:GNAT family N-acetyltransferase n=1 Tax=Roseibium sp. SCP15 TaxID=3141376 RepID=UPI00333D9C31
MTSETAVAPKIRPFEPGDLSALLAMNNAAVPAVSEATAEKLLDLINAALVCLVAEKEGNAVGFLLCLSEGIEYDSPNYHWLSERYSKFAYTDRICVDESTRGQKIGDAMYGALFNRMAGSGRTFLCEVNERPPNPGSLRFHNRLGFEEIGKADNGKVAVIYMQRDPKPTD